MSDLNEIQPIDGYIEHLLQCAVERYGLEIDPQKPTRAQRLNAAMYLKDVDDGRLSMEIMCGQRTDASELRGLAFSMLLLDPKRNEDPEQFYAKIAHSYWLNDLESPKEAELKDEAINKEQLENAGYLLGEEHTPDHKKFTEYQICEGSSEKPIAWLTFKDDGTASLTNERKISPKDSRYQALKEIDITGYVIDTAKSNEWNLEIGPRCNIEYVFYTKL